MTTIWRRFRRRILTPDVSATSLDVRGFPEKTRESRQLLETIGRMFLAGYAFAAEAGRPVDAEEHLERIPTRFRGFAYEGAAMGFAVRDGLPFGSSRNVERFLDGRGRDHIYMAYVGIGWAMARLPRFRWPSGDELDPLLRWLVLDGYGFHQAYFHTRRYVYHQFQDPGFRWPADGERWYANRAIDQGIGRAIWFVGCTDPDRVATLIDKFPAERRPDLYSGAGLAATYAGGVDEFELREFWRRAGDHQPYVAQGSVFAAEARIRSGLLVPHTALATEVFCGMSAQDAAQLSLDNQPVRPDAVDGVPAYEVWRQSIAGQFVSLGRV